MSDVLVTVRCRIHRQPTGVLLDRPNGVRHYSTTNVGIYARNRRLIGPGDTTVWNFFEPGDYARELESWCQECGEKARTFNGSSLLGAVEGHRKNIFV